MTTKMRYEINCFIISIVGLAIYYFLWNKIDMKPLGIFQYSLIPIIILIVTHLGRKTLLSFRFVKLCFSTWLYATSIPVFIAIYFMLTTRPHF